MIFHLTLRLYNNNLVYFSKTITAKVGQVRDALCSMIIMQQKRLDWSSGVDESRLDGFDEQLNNHIMRRNSQAGCFV